MSLYTKWRKLAEEERDQDAYDAFWGDYLPKEQAIYELILADPNTPISGVVSTLAKKYGMDSPTFLGFLDGINSSLKKEIDLKSLKATNKVTLELDLEKLYFNMLDAKADWLYNLPQWDALLSVELRRNIKKDYNQSKTVVNEKKIGRNDPCPCGSGRKYKQCCLNK